MGVNPAPGFYHDHLFILQGRENDVTQVLRDIAARSAR